MATAAQRERLRRDTGSNSSALSDDDADDLFEEAGETYTDDTSIAAYARILALQGILASSAKLTSYKQNESSESLSDVFKHLRELLSYWQGELDTAQRGASGAARYGGVRRKPARVREYPGS
jgi:hypothetical protein